MVGVCVGRREEEEGEGASLSFTTGARMSLENFSVVTRHSLEDTRHTHDKQEN